MILYLHGFRSSPQSFKAQLLAQRMRDLGRAGEYFCPQLPPAPAEAIALAGRMLAGHDPHSVTLIGSSLGGYYARYLAERTGCRAVLLNPALRVFEKLAPHVGPQTAYHPGGDAFVFLPEYLAQLESMHVPRITRPSRYFLLAATGDELLEWQEMVDGFPGAKQRVIQGSDHGLSDFSLYLDEVLQFADAKSETL